MLTRFPLTLETQLTKHLSSVKPISSQKRNGVLVQRHRSSLTV